MMSSPRTGGMFDPSKCIKITATIDVGDKMGLFIYGENFCKKDTAMRMINVSSNKWAGYIPYEGAFVANSPFRFFVGPYEAGENPNVMQLSPQKHQYEDFNLRSGEFELWMGIFDLVHQPIEKYVNPFPGYYSFR